jgi:hypothetical protein
MRVPSWDSEVFACPVWRVIGTHGPTIHAKDAGPMLWLELWAASSARRTRTTGRRLPRSLGGYASRAQATSTSHGRSNPRSDGGCSPLCRRLTVGEPAPPRLQNQIPSVRANRSDRNLRGDRSLPTPVWPHGLTGYSLVRRPTGTLLLETRSTWKLLRKTSARLLGGPHRMVPTRCRQRRGRVDRRRTQQEWPYPAAVVRVSAT